MSGRVRAAWRLPIVFVVVAAFALAIVAQQRAAPPAATEAEVLDPAQLMPVSQRAGVASSTFFCAGGTATGTNDVFAEHTVSIANLSGDKRAGKLTVFTDKAEPVVRPVEVGARTRTDFPLSEIAKADYAAAVVEMDGGEIAVEQTIAGPTGRARATCASAPSNRWFFPAGSTRPGGRMVLAVFNPFPDPAVLDITFETDAGGRTPQALNPLVVPGGRVTGVDVTGLVTVRRQIATTIVTRPGSGRVVVDLVQSLDGKDAPVASGQGTTTTTEHGGDAEPATTEPATTEPAASTPAGSAEIKDQGVRGLALVVGAPEPTSTWVFAEGPPLGAGIDEQYVIMNPGTEPVVADVQLRIDGEREVGPVEPYEVTVRPGQFAAVSITQDDRVPGGTGHWATVTSRGGPIVAARVVTAIGSAAVKGFSVTMGSPLVATRWLVAAADADGSTSATVTMVNPSSTTAQVTVVTAVDGSTGTLERYDQVDLAPGARSVAPIGDRKAGSKVAVSVESTQPIVVEQRLAFDASSFSSVMGEPMVGTLALAPAAAAGQGEAEPGPVGTSPLRVTDDTGPAGTVLTPEAPTGTGTTVGTAADETTEVSPPSTEPGAAEPGGVADPTSSSGP